MDEEGAEFFCAFLCQHDVLNQHGEHVSHIYRIDRTPSCYLPPEVVSSLSIHSISPTLYYISFHIFPTISCSSSLTLTLSVVDLHESVGVGGYKEKGVWREGPPVSGPEITFCASLNSLNPRVTFANC